MICNHIKNIKSQDRKSCFLPLVKVHFLASCSVLHSIEFVTLDGFFVDKIFSSVGAADIQDVQDPPFTFLVN